MELNHFSHRHPLILVEDKSDQFREAYCSGCRELIQDSSTYRCANCKFYLHKSCAELPKELHHPFHPQHPLVLYDKPQYDSPRLRFKCNSCRKRRTKTFVYHCSACQFDLDIQCALLPKLSTGDFPKLQHFSHQHSLLFIEKHYIESADESCSACEDPISGPIYCCFDCKVFLHKKCTELPLVINHPSHRKHSLTLLPNPPPPSHSKHSLALQANYPHKGYCSCHLCSKLPKGFVYYCSPCEFSIRIKYTFSHLFEAKTHEHPFTLLSRPMSFICEACGTCGEYCMPCICNICNLVVHKDCISLPHTIKLRRHEHSVFHNYFLKENAVRKRICGICRKEVNVEYGSYHCLDCDYFVHVNCARDKTLWDNEILEMEELNQKSSETLGEGEIKNFSHDHKLLLSDKMKNCEYYCNGCGRSISTAFYHCAECNYFLHKCCAELPTKRKHWWAEKIRTLNFKDIFWCYFCGFYCSGFCYVNDEDRASNICIRCFEIPDYYLAHGHDHYLLFDHKFTTECSVCNENYGKYRCEDDGCEFVLCRQCIALPETAWYKHNGYKHDEHPLALTYYDDVHDSYQCFCDICEEPRDPKKWFYYCATCDYSCHLPCALGQYQYVKLGSPVKLPIHEHHLTFMKDNLGYHKCGNCCKSCKDAFVKCVESECKYVVHYLCK